MTSAGGQPRVRSNFTIDLTYAAVPTTTPWVAIASANARSMMLPSTAAAPTTSQQMSDTGDVSLICLPPCAVSAFAGCRTWLRPRGSILVGGGGLGPQVEFGTVGLRSEEHTSELQSRQYLVCRLLLEKKKRQQTKN